MGEDTRKKSATNSSLKKRGSEKNENGRDSSQKNAPSEIAYATSDGALFCFMVVLANQNYEISAVALSCNRV